MDKPVSAGNETLVISEVISPTLFRPPGPLEQLPKITIPWLRTLLLVIGLISCLAAWFVTTANSIEIIPNPAEAHVVIKELLAPKFSGKWILRPGTYRVSASADGYLPYGRDLVISDAAYQTHRIELEPLPGHLRVEISPVESATLEIDGQPVAKAPTTVRDLAAGQHNIRILADRYKPYDASVLIEGRDIEQSISVELQPAWAEVTFDSTPQGAALLVDNEQVGVTPLSAEIIEGERRVSMKLAGYNTWQRTFNIVAGEAQNIPRVILQKADGYINLTTTPAGATITVGGDYKGRSPLKIAVAPDRELTVRAIKPGYIPSSSKVTTGSGETSEIKLTLQAELAQVRFIVTPADAEVLIDDQIQPLSNQVIMLPTHEHKILIRKSGYQSYETTITPRKGVEKRIKVRLRPGADKELGQTGSTGSEAVSAVQSKANSSGASIKTYLNQQLKLFKGGTLSMGSSRRDAARRANETQHSATLNRPFYFAVNEVTNGEFRQFLATHESKSKTGQNINEDNQPVANVSWNTAALFCNWLSRKDSLGVFYQIKAGRVLGINPAALGYRLPSEAEWAWAARTTNTNNTVNYPWVGGFPPNTRSGNFADQSARQILAAVITGYDDGFTVAAPVGSFPANSKGLYDLGGNVAEWVHDFYLAAPSGSAVDPLGPSSGHQHVIRGSSWAHGSQTELRLSFRDHGSEPRDDVGFRIARYAQ